MRRPCRMGFLFNFHLCNFIPIFRLQRDAHALPSDRHRPETPGTLPDDGVERSPMAATDASPASCPSRSPVSPGERATPAGYTNNSWHGPRTMLSDDADVPRIVTAYKPSIHRLTAPPPVFVRPQPPHRTAKANTRRHSLPEANAHNAFAAFATPPSASPSQNLRPNPPAWSPATARFGSPSPRFPASDTPPSR